MDNKKVNKDLKKPKKSIDKKIFLNGIRSAFKEVKAIKNGKKKPNSFDDLINELN